MTARDSVILVHGLWMNGMEMSVLRRRLQLEHDFEAQTFADGDRAGAEDELHEALDVEHRRQARRQPLMTGRQLSTG